MNRSERVRINLEMTGNDVMKVDWLTPPEIIKALGPFDLDPAVPCGMAHDGKPWATATKMICKCQDGLRAPWEGRIWLNPPYERPYTEQFVQRLAEHGNGICLVMARTDSGWFQDLVLAKASGIFFMRKRPHFYTPSGIRMPDRATTASVLVAYGARNAEILGAARLDGIFWGMNRAEAS
jgi:hypothetical protein